MKTIHFITPYPHAQAPSQRFRFEQYYKALASHGFEIKTHAFYDQKSWEVLYLEGKFILKSWNLLRCFLKRFLLLFQLINAKHIFIHREMAHVGPPIFEWMLAKVMRKKYVYDFDDAIWLPNYSETNARFQFIKAYWKVNYCMKWAAKISAGNDYLANYASKYNPNVVVIPTTIDTENHHNIITNHQTNKITIGWTGTHTTLYYLDKIIPILKKLEEQYDFNFIVISNQKPDFELKSLQFIKWNHSTEIEDLAQIQIGIMPLNNDIWSEGKCGFKGLQYLSLGMATILSPVGVNKTIIQNGINGFLADTEIAWENSLKQLLSDSNLRTQLGNEGRKTVEEHYSVKANLKKYLQLFEH